MERIVGEKLARLGDRIGAGAGRDELLRLHAELQEAWERSLVVPLDELERRLKSGVQRLASELHRELELEFAGFDLEVEVAIAETLADCLVHAVRNALDHGLESPEERQASGKPRSGRLEVLLQPRGEWVEVEVRDDGRGIDPAIIRARAESLQITEASSLPDDRLGEVLFKAGFSSQESTSLTSGRGTGLGAIRERIEKQGGTADFVSPPGTTGSSLRLRMPVRRLGLMAKPLSIGQRMFWSPASWTMSADHGAFRISAPGLSPCEIPATQLGPEAFHLFYPVDSSFRRYGKAEVREWLEGATGGALAAMPPASEPEAGFAWLLDADALDRILGS